MWALPVTVRASVHSGRFSARNSASLRAAREATRSASSTSGRCCSLWGSPGLKPAIFTVRPMRPRGRWRGAAWTGILRLLCRLHHLGDAHHRPDPTATAVSSERLGRTLNVLLATPITAWQIIAGKLASRLLVAITLIGLSLPVLALRGCWGRRAVADDRRDLRPGDGGGVRGGGGAAAVDGATAGVRGDPAVLRRARVCRDLHPVHRHRRVPHR